MSTLSGAERKEPEIVVREIANTAELTQLHRVRLLQGMEQAVAPVNAIKVMEKLDRAFRNPDTFVLLAAFADRDIVGYLLLQRATYDFADVDFLVDFGFYVLPQWRKNKGVGSTLLESAKVISESSGLALHIHIFNPRARRRGNCKSADVIGYVPIGSIVTFNAKGG